jgi:hypothetical protein
VLYEPLREACEKRASSSLSERALQEVILGPESRLITTQKDARKIWKSCYPDLAKRGLVREVCFSEV